MKVVVLASLCWSLVHFRGQLLKDLRAAGHEVIACAPDRDEEAVGQLQEMGVEFARTPMSRTGLNPFEDLATLRHYIRLMRRHRPDAVIAYTQKPIIYGGIAARLCGVSRFFALMSGLGYAFSLESDHRPMLRLIVARLYNVAVAKARAIFVFNSDDAATMMQHGIVNARKKIIQVPGSGVDTDHYRQKPMPQGPLTFLMIARLMRDKGVDEYLSAAALVKARAPETRFILLGRFDAENPTGYSPADVAKWVEAGLIEYVPETRDVRPHLARCHAFVLPSFYREGLPRTLLEALATGRPVITTDMPGCREPVRVNENGLLVPPRDAARLAEAMLSMMDREAVDRMGENARATAVEIYDVAKVNRLLLQSMGLAAPERREPPAGILPGHEATSMRQPALAGAMDL